MQDKLTKYEEVVLCQLRKPTNRVMTMSRLSRETRISKSAINKIISKLSQFGIIEKFKLNEKSWEIVIK